MTTLLICGSRKATPAMLDFSRKLVYRAQANDWSIIVGDADGVDRAVINACLEFHVPHIVCGAYGKIRNSSPLAEVVKLRGDYLARDRYMAERCDRIYAVWNGISTGTMYTYRHALKCGLVAGETAWLKDFSKGQS